MRDRSEGFIPSCTMNLSFTSLSSVIGDDAHIDGDVEILMIAYKRSSLSSSTSSPHLFRDGAGVLPTGRNIHALDPYRIPSVVAMERGRTAARLIIEAHRKKGERQF